MRIEGAYEDKREDNEFVSVVVSMRTMRVVNPCQQFHVDADGTEPSASRGTRRKRPDAAVAKHDSQSDEVVITIQVIGFNAETVEYKNSKRARLR